MALSGLCLLVPPARPGLNPPARMLENHGARVLEFPALQLQPPREVHLLDEALQRLADFDWILVSGQGSAQTLCERLGQLGMDLRATWGGRIGAVGHGAFTTLRSRSIRPDYVPRAHTPGAIVSGIPEVAGRRLLLIREVTAGDGLPARFQEQGAEVTEVKGHYVQIQATPEAARDALGHRVDLLALASPTAVRYLLRALQALELHPDRCLGGAVIAAVGPATAAAAAELDLAADLVAGGRLKHLVQDIVALYKHHHPGQRNPG